MIRLIYMIGIMLVLTGALLSQELLVQSPQQLGLSTSTARVGNWVFANSGLAQAYYSDQPRVTISLFVPYTQLTDGNIRTSNLQFYSPTFNWGGLSIAYLNYLVENLDKKVITTSSLNVGYSKTLLDQLIMALELNWYSHTWHSDRVETITTDGTTLDFSVIYILSGYSSVGVSITNLLSKEHSSLRKDVPASEFRVGYSWLNKSTTLSLEGGIISNEDAHFQRKIGGFISTEYRLPFGFRVGAEYKHLFHNEMGAVLSFNYKNDNFDALLSYGFRLDDSPMPISTLQHCWGIHIQLNKFKAENAPRNPQILFRDFSSPDIFLKRMGDYTLFTKNDHSDNLKVKTRVEDTESGLKSVQFKIVSASDSNRTLFEKEYSPSKNYFEKTIEFDGFIAEDQFLDNGRYLASVSAVDLVGNVSSTQNVPFRVLALENDSRGPQISLSFDDSKMILTESESNTILKAYVSINDNESDWVSWKVQLYKLGEDSVWRGLKYKTGGIEINKRKFEWFLQKSRSRTLAGHYKVKVEAQDELKNLSIEWSRPKEIHQNESQESEKKNSRRKGRDSNKPEVEDQTLPKVLYLTDESDATRVNKSIQSFSIEASYFYRDNEITLSDFNFIEGEKFNPYFNQQGLSVIGVYLQDLSKSSLIVACPDRLESIPKFDEGIREFLHEAYGINNQRIQLKYVSSLVKLKFYIKE